MYSDCSVSVRERFVIAVHIVVQDAGCVGTWHPSTVHSHKRRGGIWGEQKEGRVIISQSNPGTRRRVRTESNCIFNCMKYALYCSRESYSGHLEIHPITAINPSLHLMSTHVNTIKQKDATKYKIKISSAELKSAVRKSCRIPNPRYQSSFRCAVTTPTLLPAASAFLDLKLSSYGQKEQFRNIVSECKCSPSDQSSGLLDQIWRIKWVLYREDETTSHLALTWPDI